MKTRRSKCGAGGRPYSRSSYCARPGRKGLWGKNPVAKMKMDSGIRRLAMARRVPRRGEVEGMSISSTVHQGGEMVSEWKERQTVNLIVHLAEVEGRIAQAIAIG
jgi:hypothetical protein